MFNLFLYAVKYFRFNVIKPLSTYLNFLKNYALTKNVHNKRQKQQTFYIFFTKNSRVTAMKLIVKGYK